MTVDSKPQTSNPAGSPKFTESEKSFSRGRFVSDLKKVAKRPEKQASRSGRGKR